MNFHDFPVVSNYKYLGIFLDNNVNFKKNSEAIKKKMQKNAKTLNM